MQYIPNRKSDAITGSQFITNNDGLTGSVRDSNIEKEFLDGNIPTFLRNFKTIEVSDEKNKLTYLVFSDVLSIGSDHDYIRMPMTPISAQKIADKYDCTLPTTKMVDDIWKQSDIKLDPKPWGPPYDSSMMATSRFGIHNATIENQLKGKDKTLLISGHKKDVVLTNKLNLNEFKKNVAIYGWIQSNGKPIQQLNPKSHNEKYYDYSHSIRLIVNDVMLNGQPARMQDIFSDVELCKLVSNEGPILFQRY